MRYRAVPLHSGIDPRPAGGSELELLRYHVFPRFLAYVFGRMGAGPQAYEQAEAIFREAWEYWTKELRVEAFETWLYAAAIEDLRALEDRVPGLEAWGRIELPGSERSHLEIISRLVSELGTRDQELVRLRFDAELSYAQIATVMQSSPAAVRTRIFRLLRDLNERMDSYDVEPLDVREKLVDLAAERRARAAATAEHGEERVGVAPRMKVLWRGFLRYNRLLFS